MKHYQLFRPKQRWPRRLVLIVVALAVLLVLATIIIRRAYNENLQPLSKDARTTLVTIKPGSSVNDIADVLHDKRIIRSTWAFEWYVHSKEVRDALQAGTYSLSPSQSVPDIVGQLTHGKIATKLVTILPGQRLDQVRQALINNGFQESKVDAALQASRYEDNAALVDKPAGNSLEGYLYPDSFQKTANTDPETIITESLAEMQKHLTPDIRQAFASEGLSTYQGIILASIVSQEVSSPTERAQAAQVFLSRLKLGMPLQSDVVTMYGDRLAGQDFSTTYDTPYNVYLHKGLPPTPISNVDTEALQAVAHPAATDWLYFVTGSDCTTHFSKTLAEHEANIQKFGNGCKQ